jgi:Fic family protein
VVGPYKAAPAEDCDYLLKRLCEWLARDFVASDPEWEMPFAILKAMMAHLYLVWIHPFGDGNGRTARLMELQILLAAGAPTPTTHLLSNHYNLTRAEYYRQLHITTRSETGEPIAFVLYAVQGFVDGLRDQLWTIGDQQFADRWEQYIYERFGERRTKADHRRLQLALDLSKAEEPVHQSRVRLLTPQLAEAYAGTVRTVPRDLNELEQMGLIERTPDGFVRPRSFIIRAFLPRSAAAEQEAALHDED